MDAQKCMICNEGYRLNQAGNPDPFLKISTKAMNTLRKKSKKHKDKKWLKWQSLVDSASIPKSKSIIIVYFIHSGMLNEL